MRILLDESVPSPLRLLLPEHECISVQQRGWKGSKNGDLLRLAAAEFDLFLTSDQGILYQQNLASVRIAILQISTNDVGRIRTAAAALQSAVAATKPNQFQELVIP